MLDLESMSPGPYSLLTAIAGLFAAALAGIALGDPVAEAFVRAVLIAVGIGVALYVLRRRDVD